MQILETATLFTYIILMSNMNTWLCFGFVCLFVFFLSPFFFISNFLEGCIQDQSDFFMDTNMYYGQVYLVEVENLF